MKENRGAAVDNSGSESRDILWFGSSRYLGVSNPGLRAMSVMFPISMAPGPHSSISEEFLHSICLRPKKLESCQPS